MSKPEWEQKDELTPADILETRELALDRIAHSDVFFLVTRNGKSTEAKDGDPERFNVIWLAPVPVMEALEALSECGYLQRAILKKYLQHIEEAAE